MAVIVERWRRRHDSPLTQRVNIRRSLPEDREQQEASAEKGVEAFKARYYGRDDAAREEIARRETTGKKFQHRNDIRQRAEGLFKAGYGEEEGT